MAIRNLRVSCGADEEDSNKRVRRWLTSSVDSRQSRRKSALPRPVSAVNRRPPVSRTLEFGEHDQLLFMGSQQVEV